MSQTRNGRTLLVVDDSAPTRMRVARTLEVAQVCEEVITCANAQDALKVMSARRVDLVLCDVLMPGLDGFGFLRLTRANAQFASTPIIMLTSSDDLTAKVAALREGASDYLTIPFHSEELVARVEVHLKVKALQDELREKNERLEELSRIDALTNLSNRRHFMEVLSAEFSRALRFKSALTLVMFDADHFKRVNDTWGHLVGDNALSAIAKLAKSILRTCDHAARYGGEEFALLLPETTAEGARVVAERLRQAVKEMPIAHPGGSFRITVSLGCAVCPSPEMATPLDLLRLADEALYAAKRGGRDRVHVHSSRPGAIQLGVHPES